MKLTELLPEPLLVQMITQGYVSVRTHPTEPLAIYNYTKAAQYDSVWNPVTLACRGLIVNHETGEIVARPLAKFFTWGQAECPNLPLDAQVHVADKADGSLGIAYPTGDGWAVATRGSFTSDQAVHATELLRSKYPTFDPAGGYTYLFEIVYPDNRIVLDYGDTDDLILLGLVENGTGDFFPCDGGLRSRGFGWAGKHAKSFGWMTFAEALALPPRSNAEGVVLLRPNTGEMVKVKQDDYVALHRILTNVTARTLWEFLAVNATHGGIMDVKKTASRLRMDPDRVREVLAAGADWERTFLAGNLPDEFHDWARKTIRGLVQAQGLIESRTRVIFAEIQAASTTRKEFADQAKGMVASGLLFALLDGRDITPETWLMTYPPADKPFADREEGE
jgi:RNA ligase